MRTQYDYPHYEPYVRVTNGKKMWYVVFNSPYEQGKYLRRSKYFKNIKVTAHNYKMY